MWCPSELRKWQAAAAWRGTCRIVNFLENGAKWCRSCLTWFRTLLKSTPALPQIPPFFGKLLHSMLNSAVVHLETSINAIKKAIQSPQESFRAKFRVVGIFPHFYRTFRLAFGDVLFGLMGVWLMVLLSSGNKVLLLYCKSGHPFCNENHLVNLQAAICVGIVGSSRTPSSTCCSLQRQTTTPF